MTKATDLRQAINPFDPENELRTSEDLEAFYVPRPESPLRDLELLFENATSPQKVLFTGHRGSGKSTELAQFAQRLENQYLLVIFSAKRAFNLSEMTYLDVLISMGLQLIKTLTDEQLLKQENVLTEIINFTKDISLETETTIPKGLELGLELNALVAKLSGKYSAESSTRKIVKEHVVNRISDLIFNIDLLVEEIGKDTGRKILFIIEDLDKSDLETARHLFFDHGASLLEPRASVIYTFPIALRHDNDFIQVESNFPNVYVLPNLKPFLRDGSHNDEGLRSLTELVERRIDASLIAPEAIETMAECSGGLPRELVLMSRNATLEALKAERKCITLADAKKAASRKRMDYQVLLSQHQLALLKDIHATKRLDNTAEHRALLHNLSALEYRNDDVWYDAHPLVVPLL